MDKQWYSMTESQLFDELKTSKEGLTTKECHKRQEKYGKNILPKKKRESVLKIFLKELLNPIELLLVAAVVASFLAGEPVEAYAIILIVLVDVIMGTYQENKANNTAEVIKIEAQKELVEKCNASVVGCVVQIEKEYQDGGNDLRGKGYRVESLARIKEIKDGKIMFC